MDSDLFEFIKDNLDYCLTMQDRACSDPDILEAQAKFDQMYDQFMKLKPNQ